tara:strand:+ start:206124 stop:206897 length:774 start_codon:yes stop_codon:yes gene_type:complete
VLWCPDRLLKDWNSLNKPLQDGKQQVRHIVFLCGLLSDKLVWQKVADHLQDDFDCSIISFAGFNSLAEMAKAVLEQAPPRFILIGHSMGGRVALEAYRQSPDRIELLGLFNTGAHPLKEGEKTARQTFLDLANKEGMETLANAWLTPMMGATALQDQHLIQRLKQMVTRYSLQQLTDQIQALLLRPEVESLLPAIKVPVLLVAADEDKWSPLEQHQAMAEHIAVNELQLMHDAGHMAPVEKPGAAATIIGDFIARHK